MYFHYISRLHLPTLRNPTRFCKARVLYTHGHCNYTFRGLRKKVLQQQFRNAGSSTFFLARLLNSAFAHSTLPELYSLLSILTAIILFCKDDKRVKQEKAHVL